MITTVTGTLSVVTVGGNQYEGEVSADEYNRLLCDGACTFLDGVRLFVGAGRLDSAQFEPHHCTSDNGPLR